MSYYLYVGNTSTSRRRGGRRGGAGTLGIRRILFRYSRKLISAIGRSFFVARCSKLIFLQSKHSFAGDSYFQLEDVDVHAAGDPTLPYEEMSMRQRNRGRRIFLVTQDLDVPGMEVLVERRFMWLLNEVVVPEVPMGGGSV